MTDNNPWVDAHIEAETAFQDGDRALARKLVEMEYADGEPPIPCEHDECRGTMYYKATIGAMKCVTCGELATCSGEMIR